MTQTSYALLTNTGRAKEAAALGGGDQVVITHMAIGDGTVAPSGGETELYNETARKTISGQGVVSGASNVAYSDIFLAAAEGPYTIREAGMIDSDGDLIAIAKFDPPINKPTPDSGSTIEGTIRMEVAFSDLAVVTITVDPSMAVALQRLSVLPWIPVKSVTTTAPPGSPTAGDTYVIPDSATGSWSGHDQKVAEYTAAGWAIITPKDGHGVGLPDGREYIRISGTYVRSLSRQEIDTAVTDAGLTPDHTDVTLLSQAIARGTTRVSQRIIAASETYTPHSGLVVVDVEIVGGGGGGGGGYGQPSPNVSPGSGGGGGGYSRKIYTAEELGASAAVVIGAAGIGGTGQVSGGNGGATTFTPAGAGAEMSAFGGVGGLYGPTYTTIARGQSISPGGTASGGQINVSGTASGWPLAYGGSEYQAISGRGGSSRLGVGGQESNENNDGNAGGGYGAGGGGAASLTVSKTGANGTPGACFVTEYWRVE